MLGVRFDTRELADSVQHVDPVLLRTELLESVYHLHGQPPLYNLLLGVVLKLFPESWPTAFHALHLALGLAGAASLHLLLTGLGVPRWPAAVLASLMWLGPAAIVYENILFYDHATLVLLTLAALALQRYAAHATVARGVLFFALLAALVLTRTIFQLPWLLLAVALVLLVGVAPPRVVLAAAAVPVALVALVYVKNAVLFGSPTTSSWLGMGVARVARYSLSDGDLRALERRGEISRVSLVAPLSPLRSYRGAIPLPEPTGVAVLDAPVKRGGFPNLHHLAYVDISRRYLRDDLRLVRERPGAYLTGVKRAVQIFFWPPTLTDKFRANRERLGRWDDVWNAAVYGSTPYANRAGILLGLAYAAAALYGLRLAVRTLRGARDAAAAPLLFAWATMIYVSVGATLTEVGENYHFRYALDPLVAVLLAVPVTALVGRVRASSSRSRP